MCLCECGGGVITCVAFFLTFVSARDARRALRAFASATFLIDEALIARSLSRAACCCGEGGEGTPL